MELDANLVETPDGRRPANVTVLLKDGRQLERRKDYSRGRPEKPLTAAELREKYSPERVDLREARGGVERERGGADEWMRGDIGRSPEEGPVASPDGPASPGSSAPSPTGSVDMDPLPFGVPASPAEGSSPVPVPSSPPGAGSSPVPGASIVIPPEALHDVEIQEEDLPKMTQEADPPPNGSWKVHDDDRVERVVPREDGSYEVQFKPGVVAAPDGIAGDAASETHKRRTDRQLVRLQNQRTAQTIDLERAAGETLADAVEHGRAPFDVERAGYMPGQATNAFSKEGIDGIDGDLLRAKAIREGVGHDLRFATREQIEAAGGRVLSEAEGVIVTREVPVSAQPFGSNGRVDRNADPVEYRVKTPQVLYHVATETNLTREQAPSQSLAPPVQEMTAEDLCKSVGVHTVEMGHPEGRTEFQLKNPERNIPQDTVVIAKDGGESMAERNGRLVGAAVRAALSKNREKDDPRPAAPEGAYSKDPAKAKLERRLVEVMAADRAAGRIGVAYRTSPPVTANERKQFAQMLTNLQVRARLGKEVDRVSAWVADGAKQRLNDRGIQTVHQRAGNVPPSVGRSGPSEGRERPVDVPSR
jgi:hypothetical protein